MSGIVSLSRGQSHDFCLALEKQCLDAKLADKVIADKEIAQRTVFGILYQDVFKPFLVEVPNGYKWENIKRHFGYVRKREGMFSIEASSSMASVLVEETQEGVYDLSAYFLFNKLNIYCTYQSQLDIIKNHDSFFIPNAPTAVFILLAFKAMDLGFGESVFLGTSSSVKRGEFPDHIAVSMEKDGRIEVFPWGDMMRSDRLRILCVSKSKMI